MCALRAVLAALVLFGAAGHARAQTTTASQPYRGLFGGDPTPAPSGRSTVPADLFSLNVQAFGLFEQTSQPTSGSATSDTAVKSYSAVLAEAVKAHNGKRWTYAMRAASQFRMPAMPGGTAVDTQLLAASVHHQVSPRTAWQASQQWSYSPLFVVNTANGGGQASGSGAPVAAGLTTMTNITTATAFTGTHELSERTSLQAAYGFTWVDFTSQSSTVATHQIAVAMSHRLAPAFSWQARFGSLWNQTSSALVGASSVAAQEFGVSADRTFTISRRTMASVSVFPGVKLQSDSKTDVGGATQSSTNSSLSLGGAASIERLFSRWWKGGLRYERSWYYLPGSTVAIQADAIGGQSTLNIREALTVAGGATYSHGKPDIKGTQAPVNTFGVNVRADVRFARHGLAFVEYRRDTVTTSTALPTVTGLLGSSTRQALRGGATFTLGSRY